MCESSGQSRCFRWVCEIAWKCELSTIDSTFLLAGALTAGMYFDAAASEEDEIRALADALYRRADWRWAQAGGGAVSHGWKPETGFLPHRWTGYDEALLLYILGLASPSHSLSEGSYAGWAFTYQWERCYGCEYLYAGSLFHVSGPITQPFWLGIALAFWHQPRADRRDDRELSQRVSVAPDAQLPLPRRRFATRRSHWRLAVSDPGAMMPTWSVAARSSEGTTQSPMACAHCRPAVREHARQSATARSHTLSTVKPYSQSITPPGADAPKRSTASTSPWSPT